ncbi:DUF3604 domain-containing protein [Flagellimonas zhangzhouensis]|uniref:DUF3604 domain-containing protein n=1 Tax=Flagellimonas zhangzhouensis TaxID=1073328 RepID=A0A1H2Y8B9_9FLAO|nr:DUF3604 domain-containing protein [Allomuricauda zhangzhouensis]SDQ98806.1 Protein of unknown function [Allomuricauda zhangzhouensis]SDX00914.1 Protein of unknown function [Allomuricauda zhangzhouensis]
MKNSIIVLVILFLFSCNSKSKEDKANEDEIVSSNELYTYKGKSYEVAENPLKEAYFGEQHLHTAASMDAFIAGTRLTPDDAYRFAQGEEVLVNGKPHTINRPLDWAAVTDHGEFLGETYTLMNEGTPGYDSEAAVSMREAQDLQTALTVYKKYVLDALAGGNAHPDFWQGYDAVKSQWQKNIEATEKNYKPGTFTTIHAYEWSSAPNTANLHRNVFFRDTNLPDMPFSSNEGPSPQELWDWMIAQEKNGVKVFCNPHNSNESKGMLFPEVAMNDKPIDKSYAETRQHFERNLEMMQTKGNSEVVPDFWPNDEFADFENAVSLQKYNGRVFERHNFVRYGLTRGVKYYEELGTNPFKYGFVGGTDSHNAVMSNVEEWNYVGHHGMADETADGRSKNEQDGEMYNRDMNPGGLTGVWAITNTREAIWDGMHKRESFATSGPRIKVRFFAGKGYKSSYGSYEEMVQDGYDKGVPMGQNYVGQESPDFMVWAIKDPIAPNLGRVQIIKGWVENGEMKDTIYNVAASDGRLQADGSVPPIDAPVDLKTGDFNKEKGDPELMAIWKDPNFDPNQNAYYYVRVIQLPTARYSLWDEIRNPDVHYPEDTKRVIQERAWASPIWIEPSK